MKTGMNKVVIISLIAVGVVGALMWDYLPFTAGVGERAPEVNTFEECRDAGYPVMESYPERCATPDGRTFTREIEEEDVTPPVVVPPSNPGPNNGSPNEPIACTMDAMQCPDGSWVGRSGPNCQFVCPGQ